MASPRVARPCSTRIDAAPHPARPALSAHLLAHVPKVESVVQPPHGVAADLRQLEHLAQLLQVSGDQVQKRQPVKALGLLVRKLHDLVVALAQRLEAQEVPRVLVVKRLHGRGAPPKGGNA
eukprot:364445-Chlamydomonas_euryale.AAC.1